MIVAIPKLNQSIASCFEAARQFEIVAVKNGMVVSSKTVNCFGSEGFQHVRLLRIHQVQTLICSGIKRFYRDQLLSIGVVVIPNIHDSVDVAIDRFLAGELDSYDFGQYETESVDIVSHDQLIKWSKKLFKENGYSVTTCSDRDASLVDFVAEMKCPVCGKKINVAVCCGAQIYRVDQEIKEFHFSAKTSYSARVYVYLAKPEIIKNCDDYGIDFISPETYHLTGKARQKSVIPILQTPIEGHEKAFRYNGAGNYS